MRSAAAAVPKVLWVLILGLLIYPAVAFSAEPVIDEQTGLIVAPGFEQVKKICTVCHSSMLITQNKADRDGWLELIRWMQAKQGLQELEPDIENKILDYLATYYGPTAASRRPQLDIQFPE